MVLHWHGDAQASAKENPTERAQQGDPSTVGWKKSGEHDLGCI